MNIGKKMKIGKFDDRTNKTMKKQYLIVGVPLVCQS
jgi:hypothetical protein